MINRADTATRHKREHGHHGFLFMLHRPSHVLLVTRKISLVGEPLLRSFSGNCRAKFSKKIRFLNKSRTPEPIRLREICQSGSAKMPFARASQCTNVRNETLALAAMCVCNPDRSPVGINR
jgi:hypothetical protein